MTLTETLNTLLDRGFSPKLFSNGAILCEINLDDESFGFTIVPSDAFIRCVCWSSYAGTAYFDRHFQTLNEAIFASMLTSSFEDDVLTRSIVDCLPR